MATWEDESLLMLLGFIVVLIVGVNIIFAFNGLSNSITGSSAAALTCKDVSIGIQCGKNIYINAPASGCPADTIPVCTNACRLKSVLENTDANCANNCKLICLPETLANKL